MGKAINRVYITSKGESDFPDNLQQTQILRYLSASDARLTNGVAFSTLRSNLGYHGVAQFVATLHQMAEGKLIILAESDKFQGYLDSEGPEGYPVTQQRWYGKGQRG